MGCLCCEKQEHGTLFPSLPPNFSPNLPYYTKQRQNEREKLNTAFHDCYRLPSFTEEQKKLLKGTADFLALNFYSVSYAEHHDLSKEENVTWGYFTDQEMKATRDPSWLKGQYITGFGDRQGYILSCCFHSATPVVSLTCQFCRFQ